MNSLDTNILVYAANRDCAEHSKAFALIEQLLSAPGDWIISDQVCFEYLRALTNPAIFSHPLSKERAIRAVSHFRESSGVSFCAYEGSIFGRVMNMHAKGAKDRLYDVILAETLKHSGVTRLYTRNLKDFQGLGLAEVINPID